MQTTATLRTPPGKGGIALISLVGAQAEEILSTVFRPLRSHRDGGQDVLRLGHLVRGEQIIDETIVCRRGDALEINIHGGPAVAKAAMELLGGHGAEIAPASPAAPQDFPIAHPKWNNPAIGGELLEALVPARSELVVAALATQWSAGVSRLAWDLCHPQASLSLGMPASPTQSETRHEALTIAACSLAGMERLLHPAEVVLAGAPNVGKSTLANALVGRQVSIVHDQPGTTRDWVREPALLDGVPIWLTDTAGIWETAQGPPQAFVDAEAVRRAHHVVGKADLVLLLSTGERWDEPDWLPSGKVLRIATKADLGPPRGRPDVCISAQTGDGLDELRGAVRNALGMDGFDPSAPMAFTRRQAARLIQAAEALRDGKAALAQSALMELLEGKENSR